MKITADQELTLGIKLGLQPDEVLGAWSDHLRALDPRLQTIGRAGLSLAVTRLQAAQGEQFQPPDQPLLVSVPARRGTALKVNEDAIPNIVSGPGAFETSCHVRNGAAILLAAAGAHEVMSRTSKPDVVRPWKSAASSGVAETYRLNAGRSADELAPSGLFSDRPGRTITDVNLMTDHDDGYPIGDLNFSANATDAAGTPYNRHVSVGAWFGESRGTLRVVAGASSGHEGFGRPYMERAADELSAMACAAYILATETE